MRAAAFMRLESQPGPVALIPIKRISNKEEDKRKKKKEKKKNKE
jgi:hypothetical protein